MGVKKLVPYVYFQCPNCGHLNSSLSGKEIDNEVKYLCFHCQKHYQEKKWKEVKKKVWAYKCETCGEYVPNLDINWNVLGSIGKELLCPTCLHRKNGLVAIDGHHISKIRAVKSDMLKRSQQITDDIYILYVKTKWDRLALRYLNYMAVKEEQSFKVMPRRTVKNYLLLSRHKFIGYLAWSEEGRLPIMRQLFVVQEERRKDYATRLIQYFVEKQCPEPNKEGIYFCIESPNYASSRLFAKLGFIEIKDDKLIGVKVRFVHGL